MTERSRTPLERRDRDDFLDRVGHEDLIRVREILRISQDPLSLDSPVGEADDSNLSDFIEDQQADAPAEMAARRMLGDAVLEALSGHSVVDLGTDTDAVRIDYPDKARQIGEAILDGDAERGVFVCGSGVGASVAASKLPGIRAAICHDVYSAHQGVEHDDMNVLCLGSEVVGPSLARDLVTTFLAARFDGGERYVKRLQMIEDIERNAAHA